MEVLRRTRSQRPATLNQSINNQKNMETPTTAQQEIEAAYVKYFEALQAKDAATMADMIAPVFEWHTPEGEVLDASQARQLLEEQVNSFVAVENARAEISEFSLQGEEATFLVTEYITGVVRDEGDATKTILSIDTFRDTMQKTSGGWKFKRAHTLSSEVQTL
jgi:ketosteroid isomerase-like protein